jgi:hypothetical protein
MAARPASGWVRPRKPPTGCESSTATDTRQCSSARAGPQAVALAAEKADFVALGTDPFTTRADVGRL